jgi:pimeloyl-ACP methyl ester carboxylesterase
MGLWWTILIVACLLGVTPAMADTRVFEKSGVAVEALVDGQGPLVVMIASLGRPAEDFDDLALRVAGAGYRAVRLQPRGVGKSSGPAPGNDPSVWLDGWNSETARMQSAAAQGTALLTWWEGGRAPMLVVQGLQDRIALPENGQSLKSEFAARVTLVEIDGAGHALLPEQPQAIAAAVLTFIRRL